MVATISRRRRARSSLTERPAMLTVSRALEAAAFWSRLGAPELPAVSFRR